MIIFPAYKRSKFSHKEKNLKTELKNKIIFTKKRIESILQEISNGWMEKINFIGKYTACIYFLSCCCCNSLSAQFMVNRNAFQSSNRCWTLTPDMPFQTGSIWYTQPLNLNQNFDITVSLFFGCDPNGSDGMVFSLQQLGITAGGNMGETGIGGVAPSFDVEFDTYRNANYNDPGYNYIDITRDGDLNHNHKQNTLAGPYSVSRTPVEFPPNFRDCKFHDVRFTWNASTQIFTVFWECRKIFSLTYDIINTIFSGNPNVFWGFTSASEAVSNEQKMCLKYASLIDAAVDTVLCRGQSLQLNAADAVTYSWSPSKGLSSTIIQDPIARPDTTTKYTVRVTDGCGLKYSDTITVHVGGNPISINLGRDTIICSGQTLLLNPNISGGNYVWQQLNGMYPNQSNEAFYVVDKPGVYAVEVEKDYCKAADTIKVKFIDPPIFNLGGSAILCNGAKKILTVTADSATYRWQDGSDLNSYVITQAGKYLVSVKNMCAVVSDSFTVEYQECHKVFIPNIFSPNGDGINDMWQVYGGDDAAKIISLQIFNRWGSLVYEANNVDFYSADATWDGNNSTNGTYTYFVTVAFTTGENELFSGNVEIMR